MIKHIGTSAIMDLLLRMLTCIEPQQLRQDVLNVGSRTTFSFVLKWSLTSVHLSNNLNWTITTHENRPVNSILLIVVWHGSVNICWGQVSFRVCCTKHSLNCCLSLTHQHEAFLLWQARQVLRFHLLLIFKLGKTIMAINLNLFPLWLNLYLLHLIPSMLMTVGV